MMVDIEGVHEGFRFRIWIFSLPLCTGAWHTGIAKQFAKQSIEIAAVLSYNIISANSAIKEGKYGKT
jgi:hypothetical protein